MRKILPGLFAFLALALILNSQALAHTLYITVEDNEDETGRVLWKRKTDYYGEYTFKKQGESYAIIMDFGPGPEHQSREE